ncbi:TB2/DP1/HVA22-related protein [Penicillium concentricum]|uniref:Protein YOP1 n=1 Tax=Penicillium concentricum TaxID=293559 RepID=A0A9W9S7I4_9EURO|nr:TB2/DP1/HVA22-related protein [Penicillium concentricum]KAJ5373280.1 TB2/DP1/HVA22-related protein [Penicillium concentricum]
MFGIFADLLSSVITIFFPVFASYKALRSSDPSQLAPWLMYWVVLSVILLAESWTVFIIGWLPFYSWIRLGFMCYLVLPQTQGARLLYQDYVDPFLTHHEREIEEMIGHTHERAKALGLQYFYQAIDMIRQKVLGLPPQRPTTPPQPGAASYAQSLLSRFNIPIAGAGAGATGASANANDWYSVLSAAVGSVTSGKSREARDEELSASGNLLQRQLQSMSGAEKAHFISSQRELLDHLRTTLVQEEQSNPRGGLEADDLAYGVPLRKNRSENSFEVVDDEDLGRRPERKSSGGWTSGWFGNEQDSSGSSGTDFAARAVDEIARSRATGYDRS